MKKILKVYEKSFLVLIFTQSLIASPAGYIAPLYPPNPGKEVGNKIIKGNIEASEENLNKCKVYLTEIKEIQQKSRDLIEHFDLNVYKARLENIKHDIVRIENELKNEKDPKKRAEMQNDIQTIKAVDAELRKKGE